jgi:hypothetical protein
MRNRPLNVERANEALARFRAARLGLAGACRQAQIEIERHRQPPIARRPQWDHEENQLRLALAALLAPPPAVPKGLVERELEIALEESLEWAK